MAGVEVSILTGATIGMSIAAPFGPASVLCVQRTICNGLYPGLMTGLGIATVHLTYGALASITASRLALASQHSFVVPVIASLLLMAFAFRVLRSTVVLDAKIDKSGALRSAYYGAICFGFLNPFTPILFAAASPNLASHDVPSAAASIAGVFIGSLVWWSALSGGVSFFRTRLTAPVLNVSNKIAGFFLGAMAVTMLARTCLAAM